MNPDSPEIVKQSEQGAGESADTFPVVGIGASAGGVEALQKLLGRLRPDGMAFVVVQHLPSGRQSALPEILARATEVPVAVVREGQPLEPNHVYVAPADGEVRVEDGHFHVDVVKVPSIPRRSIDAFLRSLARQRGRAAIGLILSGSGSDGTAGLRSIKEAGGIAFVQDPATARQPAMPQAALEAGVADFCASPEQIGDELMRIGAHPYLVPAGAPRPFDQATLDRILELLRGAFGEDLGDADRGALERRIGRRMALCGSAVPSDYLERLRTDPREPAVLYADLLAGARAFFRDRDLFDSLRTVAFPRLLEARGPGTPLRLWVAGCATGEEVYSLAIALLESLREGDGHRKIQIFATDLDEQALTRARRALYPHSLEREVSPARLQRFFLREHEGYRVRRRLREMVVFARHDLARDPPFSRLDLVCCRNVLVYMPPVLQRRILALLHYALRPGGILVLGPSEPVGDGSELFAPLDGARGLFLNRKAAPASAPELAGSTERPDPAGHDLGPTASEPTLPIQVVERRVLERYAPPGVLVNETLHVLQSWGHSDRFLEPMPGAASLDLFELVRAELRPPLRATIDEVAGSLRPATSAPLFIERDSLRLTIRLEVMPVTTEAGQVCYIVLFREQPEVPPPVPGGPERPPAPTRGAEALERELTATKESLQISIEELQTTIEELQGSNEELQSSNEELETSNEELRSSNEELVTVNDELQARMGQLGVLGDDLANVLNTVSGAVLLVDRDLRIRAFSGTAERLLNLLPADVGRPVAFLRTAMMVRDLEQLVTGVMGAANQVEQLVRGTDGAWFTMLIHPYLTSEKVISGAVIEFLRAPEAAVLPAPGALGGELALDLLDALPQALLVLDEQLRVFWANRALLALVGDGRDAVGRSLDELWGGRSRALRLWTLVEEVVRGGPAFSGLSVEHPFSAGGPVMSVSARRLPGSPQHGSLTIVSLEAPGRGGHAGA